MGAAGLVYKRTNPKTGVAYIGRTKSEEFFLKRQAAHDRELDVMHDYEIMERAEPGMLLRATEESAIRRYGGPSTQVTTHLVSQPLKMLVLSFVEVMRDELITSSMYHVSRITYHANCQRNKVSSYLDWIGLIML